MTNFWKSTDDLKSPEKNRNDEQIPQPIHPFAAPASTPQYGEFSLNLPRSKFSSLSQFPEQISVVKQKRVLY